MKWKMLTDYRCPHDGSHLRLVRMRHLFICQVKGCDFAITREKREDIAQKYPIWLRPVIAQHFVDLAL